jgi:hypothetical protein
MKSLIFIENYQTIWDKLLVSEEKEVFDESFDHNAPA